MNEKFVVELDHEKQKSIGESYAAENFYILEGEKIKKIIEKKYPYFFDSDLENKEYLKDIEEIKSIIDGEKIWRKKMNIVNYIGNEYDDEHKQPILHDAVEKYKWSIAKLLIDNGANVNAVDGDLNTLLHKASNESSNDGHFVKFLLKNGADPLKKNKKGQTPLEYFYDNEIDNEILEYILLEADTNAKILNLGRLEKLSLRSTVTKAAIEWQKKRLKELNESDHKGDVSSKLFVPNYFPHLLLENYSQEQLERNYKQYMDIVTKKKSGDKRK